MKKRIAVGTRGSALALRQAELVVRALQEHHRGVVFEKKVIRTLGDRVSSLPLSRIGGRGLFVKEIENALLEGEIDMAVHSVKDLPARLPPGLILAAVPLREDPRDAWVSPRGRRLVELSPGDRVGTSSLRRAAQLLHYRPGLRIVPLRGNLHTRLRKAEELEGIVVALAGMRRLGLEEQVTEVLSPALCLPAVGQGALGVEVRLADEEAQELARPLNHLPTFRAVAAERSFLDRVEGGCQVPVAARAVEEGGSLFLAGMVAGVGGEPFFYDEMQGAAERADELGRALADRLRQAGAAAVLDQLREGGKRR